MTLSNPNGSATPFQIGYLTPDLEVAIANQKLLGVGPWVTSGWRTGPYYDGEERCVMYPSVHIGLGRWTEHVCLEFIQPDPSTQLPWAWDSARIDITTHLGYWVDNVVAHARSMTNLGARLVTAKLPESHMGASVKKLQSGSWPDWLPMAYLLAPSGVLIELVANQLWGKPFIAQYGPSVVDCVPAPPAPHLHVS